MYTEQELNDLKTKTMIIYKVQNLVNNKVYIGQTVNTFNRRYGGKGVGAERIVNLTGNNTHLKRAIKKYGSDNFKVEIIDSGESVDELNKKESHYIELYESNNGEKGYNIIGGGDNAYWNWKRVLETYIYNGKKLSKELKRVEKLHNKTKLPYKDIVDDLLRKPIFVESQKTKKINMYKSILYYCYRDDNGDYNHNSKSEKESAYMSPTKILIQCKHYANDKVYTSLFKIKEHKTNIFSFCENNPNTSEKYKEQIKEERNKIIEKKKKEQEIKSPRVNKCQLCGKEYKNVSKYCADCKRAIDEDKKKQGKTIKKCVLCNKEHTRMHETCSTQCTNKLRNIRKK